MRLGNLRLYAAHPGALVARVRRVFYDRRHPGEPWIAIGAIRFLERELRRDWSALEWGSGRSTVWFARRVGRLTSVEHDPSWFERVAGILDGEGLDRVDLRLVPMDPGKENGLVHTRESGLPGYVAVADGFADASLDFVVVDGQYRVSCVLAALDKLSPGGLLLVDDEQTFPLLRRGLVPQDWPVVCEATSGLSRTVVWRKPGPARSGDL